MPPAPLSPSTTVIRMNLSALELRPLRPEDEAVFFGSLPLWEGEDLSWYSFIYSRNPQVSFAEMLRVLLDEHHGRVAADRVPATMLYAFLDGRIVGRFHIRQRLNDFLRERGGNVGYAVAAAYRGQGVASEMMRQGLEYIRRELPELERLLITCTDSNAGSYRLIEKFGGVLQDRVFDEEHGEMIRRYWVELGASRARVGKK